MDCSRGKRMGFGLRSNGFHLAKLLNVLKLVGNGTGKPSTRLTRQGNLSLLPLGQRDVSPCLQQCGTYVSLDIRVWARQ
jgi:hypothetical protein